MELSRVWAVVVLCLTTQGLSAQMYKWADENGQVHFSDRPSPEQNSPAPSTKPVPSNKIDAEDRVKNIQAKIRARFSHHATYPFSITLQMRELLNKRKFTDLNHRLADYHAATVADIGKERDLIAAYLAFDTSAPPTRIAN